MSDKEYIKVDSAIGKTWFNETHIDCTIRPYSDIDEYFEGQYLYVIDESFNKFGQIKIVKIHPGIVKNIPLLFETNNFNYHCYNYKEIVENLQEYYSYIDELSSVILIHFEVIENNISKLYPDTVDVFAGIGNEE